MKGIPAYLPGLLALAWPFAAALAQLQPDAGQTIREVERGERVLQLPAKPAPPIATEPLRPPLEALPAVRIPVKAIRITGSTAFPAADLAALVKDLEGREATLEDLERAAQRITEHYRSRGYLVARAYVPAQQIRDGIVEIAVIEGRIGKLDLRNRSRLGDPRPAQLLGSVVPGMVVEEEALERGLLLLSDTPGVVVAGAGLQPGASAGTSDLAVELDAAPLISGFVDYDNQGNRFTGEQRLGANASLNSPLRIGDQVTLRLIASEADFTYARLAYQLPLGASGLRVGAAYFDTRYKLGKDFAALNADGDAQGASVFGSYPLIRTRRNNLTANASYNVRLLEDRVGATATVTQKRVHTWSVGLAGERIDAWGGGGISSYSASWNGGELRIESAGALAADAAGPQANGNFGKLSYSLSRRQYVDPQTTVFVAVNGQRASKNLDSSEKFSLGGATGVRAYPVGEGTGDEGYVATVELRRRVAEIANGTLQLAVFYDRGSVKINRTSFAAGTNQRDLAAIGIGANWSYEQSWVARASLAWKARGGTPQSDVDRTPRFWLQVMRFF